MADFEKAIPHILKYEGGYVWHKKDPGGETNLGITDRLDGKVDGMIDLDGDGKGDVTVKGLTVAQAKQVYKKRFWDVMKGDDFVDQQVATLVFDGFVNMGANGIKMLQRALYLVDDGKVGPKTLNAVNAADPRFVFTRVKALRQSFYISLADRKPDMKVFLKGWLNRIQSFEYK
jgi:type VI secretion system secreted protein VgrG